MSPKDLKKSLALKPLQIPVTECLQDIAVLELWMLSQGQESFYGEYIVECYSKKYSKNYTDSFDKYGKYLSHC